MELNTASPFLQHENSLKTHEKVSTLPDKVKEIHGVLSEFPTIGGFDDGTKMKKKLREKQQEDRVLIRRVPKKVLDVCVGGAVVYNQSSLLDRIPLRVRLPSKGDGRSALVLDLDSPASQTSSPSDRSSFARSEASGADSLSLHRGEAQEDTAMERSSDSGYDSIAQSSPASTLEALPSFPEQSTERANDQPDSRLPDRGEKKEEEEKAEGERAKKEDRFADALGLDPGSGVEHTDPGSTDPPATVPPDDLRDLSSPDGPQDHDAVVTATADPAPRLRTCFAQPGSSGSFSKRIHDQKVLLESLSLNDLELSVTGCVNVVNISYVKRVYVRLTVNDWMDFVDLDATYSRPANEFDEFLFKINLPKSFGFGGRLEFAVCYESASQVHWDNNLEANYRVEYR